MLTEKLMRKQGVLQPLKNNGSINVNPNKRTIAKGLFSRIKLNWIRFKGTHEVHDGGRDLVGVLLLVQGEAEGVEGRVRELELLVVVDGVHLDLGFEITNFGLLFIAFCGKLNITLPCEGKK